MKASLRPTRLAKSFGPTSPKVIAEIAGAKMAPAAAAIDWVIATIGNPETIGNERLLSVTSNADTGLRPTGRYSGDQPVTVSQAHPPVRFRNLESPDSTINQVAFDGFYYFTVEMGGDSTAADENFQAPVRLAVAVDGQESGAPEYAGEVAGESAGPSAEESASPEPGKDVQDSDDGASATGWAISPWVVVAAGVALLLLVAGAIFAGFRAGRRRR